MHAKTLVASHLTCTGCNLFCNCTVSRCKIPLILAPRKLLPILPSERNRPVRNRPPLPLRKHSIIRLCHASAHYEYRSVAGHLCITSTTLHHLSTATLRSFKLSCHSTRCRPVTELSPTKFALRHPSAVCSLLGKVCTPTSRWI